MKQVNRLLKLQLELAFRIPLPATDVHGSVIQQLETSLDNLKISLPEVLSLIDKELAKLRPICPVKPNEGYSLRKQTNKLDD